MPNGFKINSESGSEPVTQAEAKNFLRLDSDLTADDDLIDDLITAARIYCENYTQRAFKDKNVTIEVDEYDFINYMIPLRFVANASGLSINKIYQGSSSVLSTDYYELDTYRNMIRLKYNKSWPDFEYLQITYDVVVEVDDQIKLCILNWIFEEYEYRMKGKDRIRTGINNKLDQYRLWRFK